MDSERIDLNADVGEGVGRELELIPLLSSANVACGLHAGDDETMRATVRLARTHGVAVGAHPSFPDRGGFGRREMTLPARDVEECVAAQIRRLRDIAGAEGVRLQHVKPHGALYNMAARDAALAAAIARATAAIDSTLILVGLAGSALLDEAARLGLRTAGEAFADRAYRADGTLLPRSEPGSVIHDGSAVAARALALVREHAVVAADGSRVPIHAETICVHGDTPDAAGLAARIRQTLLDSGVELKAIGAA